MSQELILIRGLPGSGKTTWAKSFTEHTHLETDMYFEGTDGEYEWRADRLKAAHEWCLAQTMKELAAGFDVVVSNTFTQNWEMRPYKEGAKSLGVTVRILEAEGEFINIHNVPQETIYRMRTRWEKLDD